MSTTLLIKARKACCTSCLCLAVSAADLDDHDMMRKQRKRWTGVGLKTSISSNQLLLQSGQALRHGDSGERQKGLCCIPIHTLRNQPKPPTCGQLLPHT